jgi:hypothetical protein
MFTQVIFNGGFLSVLIWLLLFATSTAAVAISIKLFMAIRRGKFISDEFSDEVTKQCRQKDLNEAFNNCRERGDVFSQVMTEIFKHYNNDQKTHEESAMGIIDKSARNLLRRINTLQMCRQYSPNARSPRYGYRHGRRLYGTRYRCVSDGKSGSS